MTACKKSDSDEVSIFWQVDLVEVYSKTTGQTTIVDAIEYDEKDRVIRFGNDTYSYDAQGKISNLKIHINEDVYHDYVCFYDEKRRMTELRWVNGESNMSSSHSLVRKDRKFFYDENSRFPAVVEQPYFTHFLWSALWPPDMGVQTSEYSYRQGNIVQEIRTVKGVQSKRDEWWSPGSSQEVTVTSKNTFVFDTKDNVYRKLFGQVGYIPRWFAISLGIDNSFLHSMNNVVRATSDQNIEMSLLYRYDNQQRVVEIEGGWTIVKIQYR